MKECEGISSSRFILKEQRGVGGEREAGSMPVGIRGNE